MIVYCSNFGTIWFHTKNETGASAWFNLTGIRRTATSSMIRRRWTYQGSVRFNGDNFPWVRTPNDLLGKRYFCSGVEQLGDESRLLVAAPASNNRRIDAFLVSIRSEGVGYIRRKLNWKSKSTRLISASGGKGGPQEFLLLVRNRSWVMTDQGYWQWQIDFNRNGRPRIEFVPVEAEPRELGR